MKYGIIITVRRKYPFDNLVQEFNETVGAEKGIVIEAFSQGNVSELSSKVLDAANKKVGAGEMPDIFASYSDTALQIDKLGLVAELDKYLSEDELNEYIPEFINEGRLTEGGKIKIFPIAKSTELLMLNKTDWDKFANATGAKTEDLQTMEGVVEIARKYYEWSGGKAFFGRDTMDNYFIIGCKQLGMEIFASKDGKADFQLDEAVIRKLWDNYYVPFINGYFTAKGQYRADDATTGDIIALICSTTGVTYFPDTVNISDSEKYNIEALALPLPVFEDGEKVDVQQGAGMVVAKSDEKTEYAATVFLKWFTDKERNIEYSLNSGYMPVKKEANRLEALQQAMDKADENSISNKLKISIPVVSETINNYKLYSPKAFDGAKEARDVLSNSLQNKAKEDYEAIMKRINDGEARQTAIAGFDNDNNFKQWLDEFKQELNNAVK